MQRMRPIYGRRMGTRIWPPVTPAEERAAGSALAVLHGHSRQHCGHWVDRHPSSPPFVVSPGEVAGRGGESVRSF